MLEPEEATGPRASVARRGDTTGRQRVHRLLLLVGATFAILGAVLLGLSSLADGVWRDILLAFGAGLLTGAMVEIIFELFIETLMSNLVERSAEEIKSVIAEQTEDLSNTSKSLEAMAESSIFRVYKDRAAAAPDMLHDLTAPNVSNIRIIGISMNDFLGGQDSNLERAWLAIIEYVYGKRAVARPLDIKLLIIDPDCRGAQIRARGEARDYRRPAGRLKDDVENAVEVLEELKAEAKKNAHVSFDYRLYVLPPILFLCRTDAVSYMHQYHFWSARGPGAPLIPVFGFRAASEPAGIPSMHQDILVHFDWIWEKASVEGPKGAKGSRSMDKAIHQLGVQSVFVDPDEALEHMLLMIREAKRRVYLQGISLKSFFDPNRRLFQEVANLAEHSVDLKILLLDPQCEQARYRSFREHLIEDPHSSLDDYRSGGLHEQSTLFTDTNDAIARICRRLMAEPQSASIQVRTFSSAPACFMLLVDDSVVVEQYVYGKVQPETGHPKGVILGKDMPLVEYSLEPSQLFPGADPLRNPFKLLLDHFEFVFDNCAKPVEC